MASKEINDVWGIIMMAGMGTRMKSTKPKVLHEACGKPLARWVLDSCDNAGLAKRVLVVGHMADDVMARFPSEKFTLQKPQKGTGHAVMVGLEKVPRNAKHVMVLSGDVPCLSHTAIRSMIDFHLKNKSAATVLSFLPPDPGGYGRVIRNEDGKVTGIIEDKDLAGDQCEISECNSGIYVFNRKLLDKALATLRPNKKSGEYHLPDVLHFMLDSNAPVEVVGIHEWIEALGVNTRLELSEAADYLRWQIIEKHMASGVTFMDPASTWIGPDVKIGMDSEILAGCLLSGETKIGPNCIIGPYAEIENSTVAKDCRIRYSVIENSRVDENVKIGPYAHIRPGTRIRKNAGIGNFVELKNTDFGEGSKSGHLTYLGDAKIGKNVNVGAGTITCNFDGTDKHQTIIGDDVFIGSDTILVAPIKVGKGAYTAAGSALSEDVPSGALGIGRARQRNKKGWVKNKGK